eukprot:5228705-Amphidinium_carterae.1
MSVVPILCISALNCPIPSFAVAWARQLRIAPDLLGEATCGVSRRRKGTKQDKTKQQGCLATGASATHPLRPVQSIHPEHLLLYETLPTMKRSIPIERDPLKS